MTNEGSSYIVFVDTEGGAPKKGYPSEVLIPEGLPVTGAILADQVKSLDWRVRETELISTLPAPTIHEVVQKVGVLLTESC